MNRLPVLLFVLLCTAIQLRANTNNLTLLPEKPEAGKKVTYTYDLTGTALAGKTIRAEIVEYNEWNFTANDLQIKQEGNRVTGFFTPGKQTDFIMLGFMAAGENKKELAEVLPVMLYSNGRPAPHSTAFMGMFLYGRLDYFRDKDTRLGMDSAKGLEYIYEEMNTSAEMYSKYALHYIAYKVRFEKKETDPEVVKMLNEYLEKVTDLTQYDLQYIQRLFVKLKDSAAAARTAILYDAAVQRESQLPEAVLAKNIETETDPKKLLALVNKHYALLLKKDPKTPFPSHMYRQVLTRADEANNHELFNQVAARLMATKQYNEITALASIYNSMAWQLSGGSIEAKARDLDRALALSQKSLSILEDIRKNPNPAYKPQNLTMRQVLNDVILSQDYYADTYALLLYKKGRYAEALKYQELALRSNSEDKEVQERLVVYLDKVKGKTAAAEKASELFAASLATEKIIDTYYKDYYTQKHGAEAWAGFASERKKAIHEKKVAEWKSKMVNYAAHKFSLKDLEGKNVSLESLSGKIVVVDFWATWCGPCRASFPAMTMAQEKYRNDAGVKFVFIDSWESGTPAETDRAVSSFITKNKYPFHVLMDYDSKVIVAYGVSGIPTKFIIDTAGNVRFVVRGFNSTNEELVEEMTTIIDILRGA